MPKIRGIKPEFWTDENVMELSIAARLLFIGLWNLACDNGHVPDKTMQIKMRLMPMDDVDIDGLLNELVDQGRLIRDDGIITIRKFAQHQKPHRKWWTCCDLPNCKVPEDAPEQGFSGRKSSAQPLDNGGATVVHGRTTDDGDGDGEVDSDGEGEVARKRATRLPDNWQPTEAHAAFAATNHIDLNHEADKFRDYNRAKAKKYVEWNSAFAMWLRNEVKFASQRARPAPVQALPHAADVEEPPDGLTDEQYRAWWESQRRAR